MTTDKKIVWLASYPKSGNTWFRLFLTALLEEGELNINGIKNNSHFSSRSSFEAATGLDSTELFDKEVRLLLPDVYTYLNSEYDNPHLFVKIHDAYTLNSDRKSVIPFAPTLAALYFMRNPLDVVGSFAHHSRRTIDYVINMMNDDKGEIGKLWGAEVHFMGRMLNWSAHVESWTENMPFPVLVVRYEDMVEKPIETFSKAVSFLGIDVTVEQLARAIDKTKFQNLQKAETEQGFKEAPRKNAPFFRKGKVGNWVEELTTIQAEKIKEKHKKIMQLYNYL